MSPNASATATTTDDHASQRLLASREHLRLAWMQARVPQGKRALDAMGAAERAKSAMKAGVKAGVSGAEFVNGDAHADTHANAHADAHPPASAPWTDALKTVPGATILLDAVRGWWWQHPLRLYGVIAAQAGAAVAKPVAQRHPVALVGGAFVVGALLAWSRPWRWIIKPALFAGLVPQLATKTLAHLPMQSWLGMLSSMASTPRRTNGDARPPLH